MQGVVKYEKSLVTAKVMDVYRELVKDIKSDVTKKALVSIMFNDDMSEASNLRKAYDIAMITDSMSTAEGYKNANDMIIKVTGLNKASVSQYQKVAKMFLIGADGKFNAEKVTGWTIAKLQEIAPMGSVKALELIENGTLHYSMTSKKLREIVNETIHPEKSKIIDGTAKEVGDAPEEKSKEDTGDVQEEKSNEEARQTIHLMIDGEKVALIIPTTKEMEERIIEKYHDIITIG